MNLCLKETFSYLYENKISIVSFGGLLITSAVKVLPVPGTPFSIYAFLYDWSHQFFNLTNNRVPNPPETPKL